MSSNNKQRPPDDNRAGGIHKEKSIPVAENSLQGRAPGSGPSEDKPRQSVLPGREMGELSASQQSASSASGAGERGGAGSQQGGWSARQQGQRIQARGEEERLGQSRESGYGGMEQYQHAGSQESPIGPAGGGESGSAQVHSDPDKPASDFHSRSSNTGGDKSG